MDAPHEATFSPSLGGPTASPGGFIHEEQWTRLTKMLQVIAARQDHLLERLIRLEQDRSEWCETLQQMVLTSDELREALEALPEQEDWSDRLDALENTLDGLGSNIGEVQSGISDLEAAVDSLDSALQQVASTVDSIESGLM